METLITEKWKKKIGELFIKTQYQVICSTYMSFQYVLKKQLAAFQEFFVR